MRTIVLEPQHSSSPVLEWNAVRLKWHKLCVRVLHGGVDPHFRRATRDLYFEEIRFQLSAIERFQAKSPKWNAKLSLMLNLRTRRLIRYTEYHALPLNEHHQELLQAIYVRVFAIRSLRIRLVKSMLRVHPSPNFRSMVEEALSEVPSYKLLNLLGQEGLKRCT